MRPARSEIVVDLAAIRHNVATLRRWVAAGGPGGPGGPGGTGRPVAMMTVVKADGYGHGIVESGRAARAAGAEWLGVATHDEARALRAGGDTGRLLCWLGVPGEDHRDLIAADVDLTAYGTGALEEIAVAAAEVGRPARVQLKVDTGLSRGGATMAEWEAVLARAVRGEQEGSWRITGVWSHLASADDPDDPANDAQQTVFDRALAEAETAGLRPEVRHLANSAAAILRPAARYDLVRCGIASYGLDPAPGRTPDLGLVPAMALRTGLALVKEIEAGAAVSYGHTWTADRATTVGLVPVGYADGVPRAAGNTAEVWVSGRRRKVRGVICMDQFVVDLDGDRPAAGEPVTIFGAGLGADGSGAGAGVPTAQDWAAAADTISYEIVTRLGGRLTRRFTDSGSDSDSDPQPDFHAASGVDPGALR